MSTSTDAIDNPDRDWKIQFYLPLEILSKTKLFPLKFCKIVLTHWKFRGQEPRSLEITH